MVNKDEHKICPDNDVGHPHYSSSNAGANSITEQYRAALNSLAQRLSNATAQILLSEKKAALCGKRAV